MARPGLEPGTPRFSVMDRNLSNSRGIPAFERVLAIDTHQLDVRKLRSFRVDLGTESRFGAQWALAPVAPPRRVACPCVYGRDGEANVRLAVPRRARGSLWRPEAL